MFEHCPFRWYNQYILRVVSWQKAIYFQVGSAAHAAIEVGVKSWDGNRKTVPELVGVFSQYLKNDGIVDPDTLQYNTLIGQNMLQGWYGWMSTLDKFQLQSAERKIQKDSFLGVVDCQATIDGQPYIIDWKTSAHKYTQKQTDTSGQLTAYLWLTGRKDVKVAHGVLIKGSSRFQFLESTRDQSDVDEFLERVQKMREVIRTYTRNEPEQRSSRKCQYCDVYKLGLCSGDDDF